MKIKTRHPGASLLIVDDDPDGREAIEKLLRYAGYTVASCSNGIQALEHLRRSSRPDAILLDVMMPKMDGIEFRAEQKKDASLASIPVVVVSAQGNLQSTIEANAYLDKPLMVDTLVETIDGVIVRASV